MFILPLRCHEGLECFGTDARLQVDGFGDYEELQVHSSYRLSTGMSFALVCDAA